MKARPNYLLLLGPLFLLLLSCKEEILCPEIIEVGRFELLPSSKELFPYKDSIVHIIFRDSLHNEISATASKSFHGLVNTYTSNPCIHQTEMSIRLKAQTEFLKYFVSIPAIDIGFDISFRTIVNFQEYESDQVKDGANITFVESATNAVPEFYPPQIALTVDQRNYPELFFPQEPSVHDFLLGKQFNEVYTNKTGKEKILFHYNHEFGIIGFKLQPDGNYWVFDRFE